jgi:hypothetical protein
MPGNFYYLRGFNMRFLKVISGLAFIVLSTMTMQTHASAVPASCSWSLVSESSSGSAYVRNDICKDGSATVATRTRQYGTVQYSGTTCTITGVYSPYQWASSTCDNPSFVKVIPDPVATCGPNAGKVWGTYRLGLSAYTAPASQINAFCGSCGYTAEQISTDQGGSTYRATCKYF